MLSTVKIYCRKCRSIKEFIYGKCKRERKNGNANANAETKMQTLKRKCKRRIRNVYSSCVHKKLIKVDIIV